MFLDKAKLKVKAGDGGSGVVSFRREAFIPKGGPDGGNGGKGGSVYAVADPQLHTLLDFKFKPKFEAEAGQPGGGSRSSGRSGKDIIIKVPIGTRFFEGDKLIVDLNEAGQKYCIAKGGNGGRGNAAFATPSNRTPRKCTPGGYGEEWEYSLELKLMADVGLVGLPNAGKSTLLSVLTAARPKVAPYPFTTLHPNLGIVRPMEYTAFVMADIPGLIEGASEGKGLGYEFLRHIERTRVLVYLIDCTSESKLEDLEVLKKELERWNPDLLKRPSITVLSKVDLLEGEPIPEGPWTMAISSAAQTGTEELIQRLWVLLQEAPYPEVFRAPEKVTLDSKDDWEEDE
ncbi:GTPase ObgE [bacterium]|nr:MAG: GTPase ObgE [bacterium]